jgi:hypothetical protein
LKPQTNGTHEPKPAYEEGDVIVLWNQAVHTDREVTANRPDIIIKNTKEKTCTLIDVAIPADRNVSNKLLLLLLLLLFSNPIVEIRHRVN